jgi:hypothetical protein
MSLVQSSSWPAVVAYHVRTWLVGPPLFVQNLGLESNSMEGAARLARTWTECGPDGW